MGQDANALYFRNASQPTVKIAKEFLALRLRSIWHMHSSSVRKLTRVCRYVESEYQLEIGAAQATQLSKAIASGEMKGIFVLPKGLYSRLLLRMPIECLYLNIGYSGRVKLAPKSRSTDAATKEV